MIKLQLNDNKIVSMEIWHEVNDCYHCFKCCNYVNELIKINFLRSIDLNLNFMIFYF